VLTREEMVRAKASSEGYASRHGVRIMHYHMDNGIFTQYLFKWTYKHYATISYCGVGANHQNGQVEKLMIYKTKEGQCFCMSSRDGQRQSPSTFGHMHTMYVWR